MNLTQIAAALVVNALANKAPTENTRTARRERLLYRQALQILALEFGQHNNAPYVRSPWMPGNDR